MDDKTMLEQECDGDCGEHHGPVLLTTVVDERDGSEWEFFYCDAARESDTRHGFSVAVAAAEIGKGRGVMVTPEMLLFLAWKMGLGPTIGAESGRVLIMGAEAHFNPATDDAQFGRLVVWAAQQGAELMLTNRHAFAGQSDASNDYAQPHDSTPDSIRAAAVVAVCRALGWEGKE